MKIEQVKRIEDLCKDGVIIATQDILVRDNKEPQNVGEVMRVSYGNWESDRQRLIENEPENVVNAVMAIWGDKPTIDEQSVTIEQ